MGVAVQVCAEPHPSHLPTVWSVHVLMAQTPAAKSACEAIGVAALNFVGIGSLLALSHAGGASMGETLLVAAAAHGLIIAVMVSALGHISGGNINPAVTVALWAARRKSAPESLVFVAAQLAGGILGAMAARWVFGGSGEAAAAISTPHPGTGISIAQAFGAEMLLTFLLVWVVFATAIDRDGTWFRVAGIPIGMTVSACILAGGAVSGASMNPARFLGPALINEFWPRSTWVYLCAPLLGGILAGLSYSKLIGPRWHDAPQPKR